MWRSDVTSCDGLTSRRGTFWRHVSPVDPSHKTYACQKHILVEGAAVNCNLCWKLNFPTRNCSRNHSKNKAQATYIGLLSAWLSKFTIIGRNVFTARPLSWSNMVENSTASDADDFHADFLQWFFNESSKSGTFHCSERRSITPQTIFHIPVFQ